MSRDKKDRSDRPTWVSKYVPHEIVTSSLYMFDVKLTNGSKVSVNMAHDIEIDYECLEQQMDEVSGQYTWWAAIYSEARAMVALLERRIKVRRGVLIDAAVSAAHESKVRITNDQAERIIESDEKLNLWEDKLIVLQKDTGKLYHMLKAIEIKSEQLRSRSGFKRQERDLQK